MAAFEKVSKLTIRPLDRESDIDIRSTRLPSSLPQTGEYDPHEHREPGNHIKVWMAYFNLLRTGLGAGVLGVPLAISQAGMILGPTLALFTGFLITHMHLILLKCLNQVSTHLRIPYISYRYGFRIALLHGPPAFKTLATNGPTIIATFMLLSQLGICTVFVTFTSDSLRDIMDWQDSKPALFILLLPYLLLEFFMKNLKIVSYVSMLGNLMNMIGLILIFYHIFKEPHGEIISVATEALPVLFAFGTFLFNLSAVGVILSLDKAVLKPKVMIERYGVVRVGILVPTLIATTFGILGYWSFGTMEENVLSTSMASIGLYMIAVAFAYPIQCYPAIQIITEVIRDQNVDDEPSEKTMMILEMLARPMFVMLSCAAALGYPLVASYDIHGSKWRGLFFAGTATGPFVAFVGNVCTTMLALVFPAMMEISMMYPGPYGKYNVYLIKDVLIIILGSISFVFGALLCGYLIYVRIMSVG